MAQQTEQFTYHHDNTEVTLEREISSYKLVSIIETSTYDSKSYKYDKYINRMKANRAYDNASLPSIEKHSGDVCIVEKWHIDNKLSRADGPAVTRRYPSGKIRKERWFTAGKLNRGDDLPAVIHYAEDGSKISEAWYIDNKLHREGDKPALINAEGQWYYINGEIYFPKVNKPPTIEKIMKKTEKLLKLVADYKAAEKN
jgi:hypothetical protein